MKTLLPRYWTLGLLALLVSCSSLPIAYAATEKWSNTGWLSSVRLEHTATLLANGKVLVAGGYNYGPSRLYITELFDPAIGTWTNTGSMNDARYLHTATLLQNGKVLITGGYSGGVTFSSAELYGPANGIWTYTGSLNTQRSRHTATLLANGKVLVAGGYRNGSISSAELYDPATGIWTNTGSMFSARQSHTATLLANGKVLVAGGEIDSSGATPVAAELYDPITGLWKVIGSMSSGRYNHTATLLANGKVLVAGGCNAISVGLSGAELYDPLTESWITTGSMNITRESHTASLLGNGKVLVSGGHYFIHPNNYYLESAELYDPATGKWTITASMSQERACHTATLLNNAKVLVAGGIYFDSSIGNNIYLSTAELYDPTFTLAISTLSQGQVSGNASPYLSGSTATLTATPSPGYIFSGWTGDVTSTDNPLSVLMDTDKAVSAVFGPDTDDDDDDGLTNYQEIVEVGSNPTIPDTDGDQVKDGDDAFPLDPAETLDTDGDGTGDNADTDDDGDGLSDEDEINVHGTNPKRADSDGDGLSDPAELQTHLTNPNLADSDDDGLSDGTEVNTHGTLPKVADSDGDGFFDGYEVLTGKSPLDDQDKPALVAEARTAIEFTFPSALGKTYRIEDSLDLATWTTVESGIAGNGQMIQRFYSVRNVPKRYFRVEEDGP